MSPGFAGSRSVDDRRRRRLAQVGLEELGAVGEPVAAGAATDAGPPVAKVTHFPLRKLISPRAWKLWAVSLAMLMTGAGLLLGCWAFSPRPEVWGPGVVRLLDPVHGRLPRLFTTGCLLLAAQGALLVYWIRSRSLRDFAGRYRVWLWTAGLLSVLGVAVATDGHTAWSQAVCRLWTVRFAHRDVLCWLVPLASVGAVVLGRLLRDARGCRSSSAMFVLAAVCCAALALWRLGRLPWPPRQHSVALAMTAVQMLAGWAVLSAMLLHARFVIHYTAEPPAQRQRSLREKHGKRTKAEPKAKASRKPKPAEPKPEEAGQRFLLRRWWSKWHQRRAERRAERLARREERQAERERVQAEKVAAKQQAQAGREAAKEQARAERERLASERQAEKERLAAERQAERERAEAERERADAERRASQEAARQQAQAEKAARKQPPAAADPPKPEVAARTSSAPKPVGDTAKPERPAPPQTAPVSNDPTDDDPEDSDGDDGIDPALLKGLSKSQKRKLRKAHREAQRGDRRAA